MKSALGLDRAIAYAVSARIWTVLSNTGTVVLMLRFLSPIEQGYYFTLISLVALQVVFELGFSFVIIQLAAHERAHLTRLFDGSFTGDPIRCARLASILQLTFRWYLRAAFAVGAFLLPLGIYFFSRNQVPGVHVRWFLPWLLAVVACVYLFLQIPFCAFLEGCGEIHQVARLRLHQCIAATVLAWASMFTHLGLFAPGMTMVATSIVGTVFLWRRRRFLLGLFHHAPGEHAVSWRHEIWPFQWKIAASWLCAYFTLQVFTPMLFHYRSAVEAGQMGMSISIVGYLSAIVLAWLTTKAAPFGQLVARGALPQLDQLFLRTLRQAGCLLALLVAACMLSVGMVQRIVPALAARLVAPRPFGLLLLGTVGSILVQSMAIYLRSFKREPFLWQSITVAALTLVCARFTVKPLGALGMSSSYFVCTGIIGLISAIAIFQSWRRSLANTADSTWPVGRKLHPPLAESPVHE